MDGRRLTFRLAGINNQNFVMEDLETGSWWQQVTGEAFLGPMKGRRLTLIAYDQITFDTWRRESSNGRVLRPDEAIARAGKYARPDWEARMQRTPAPASAASDTRLPARALVIGVDVNGSAKAYPVEALKASSAIVDKVGDTSILIVLGADKRSLRVFDRTLDGKALEFVVKVGADTFVAVDVQTGSEWDFTGTATSGPLKGRTLARVPFLEEYWFDWKTYHPDTQVLR